VIIVSDTTPLSELAKVGQLNLLRDMFGQVIIPEEVYNEVTTGTHPAVSAVQSATWIEVRSVSDIHKVSALQDTTQLDLGECAAIILAEELGVDQLLIDDLAARRVALSRNLPIIGTIGTLLLAKDQGLIPSVKEVLDALIAQGKRISQRLYQEALAVAQE
jgi:predicted nucleic acid-binding protein